MNAVANISKPSPVDAFVGEVLPPDRRQSLFSGMPSHIKPAVFERNLVNAVMANTSLMKYDPRLVYREVSKAAGLGLLLDPQLGEAYIIEAYNYKTKNVEPLLRVGYRGLVKLARQSGEIEQVYAHEVYSLDHLECDLGVEKRLIHKPILFSERGVIVGYYSVVKYKGGDYDFEPMSVTDVHAIRDRSDAWKAFKDGKIKSTPWSTDDTEMSKKTVIRRLVKRVPQSPELADALRLEDQAEGVIEAAVRAVSTSRLPPAPAARQVAYVETHQPDDGTSHDPATGEVRQEDSAREEPKSAARRASPKPAEAEQETTTDTSRRQASAAKDEPAAAGSAQQGDAYDGQALLAELQAMFDQIDSVEALNAYTGGNGRSLAIYNSLNRTDQEDANHRYQQAKARIEAADADAERTANEAAASEAGDPVGPDERGHPEDGGFPGDAPSKLPPAEKKPQDMNAKELIAYHEAYIASWTGRADDLKQRFRNDSDFRDAILSDDQKKALRGVWNLKMGELRERED